MTLGGGVTGSLTMAQTSPSTSPMYANAPVRGSVSCQLPARQLGMFFGTSAPTPGVLFSGALSDDGTFWTGGLILTNVAQGTFQGDAPTNPTSVISACSGSQICTSTMKTSKTASYPAQVITLIRHSTGPVQDLELSVKTEKLVCPHATPTTAPVVREYDSFPKNTPLTASVTLQNASQTTGWHVCYSSKAAFKSVTNPTVAKAGTAELLTCAASKNAIPCVKSQTHAGHNVTVTITQPNDASGYWDGDKYEDVWNGANNHFDLVR
jgi:hypothetical protein